MKGKPFLSQMLWSFQNDIDVFFVLRLEQNGSLANMLQRHSVLDVKTAQHVIVDVLLGLKELHKRNIMHGDLKPSNILIDKNNRAHVADFGLCVNFKEKPIKGIWGTRANQSPEQYFGVFLLDERVDLFNVGIAKW